MYVRFKTHSHAKHFALSLFGKFDIYIYIELFYRHVLVLVGHLQVKMKRINETGGGGRVLGLLGNVQGTSNSAAGKPPNICSPAAVTDNLKLTFGFH